MAFDPKITKGLLTEVEVSKDKIVKSLNVLKAVVAEKVDLDDKNFGKCPFHDDEKASFNVFKSKKSGRARYYCFGCGAQGDVFNFLRAMDNMGYNEALAKLSDLIGRAIEDNPSSSSPSEPSARRIAELETQYSDLREDYYLLMEENIVLREAAKISDFRPINELSTDKRIAEWVVKTCETFGTSTSTAYRVAGLFIQGLKMKGDQKP